MNIALYFFLILSLGHVVGDFLLQPYWLVLSKRQGWLGLVIHVGVVTFITAVLAWNSIPNWWVWMIVLFIGHLFIDQFRTFVFTDNTKGKGLLLLILDQIAHFVLIGLIAWAATGWTPADLADLFSPELPSQYYMMAYLIGLAAIIGVVPVLEAEIAVAVLAAQGRNINYTVPIESSDRILGGLERVGATLLILFGLGLLCPLIFLPRLYLMVRQGQAKSNRSTMITKIATSFIAAVVIGVILVNVPPPVIYPS